MFLRSVKWHNNTGLNPIVIAPMKPGGSNFKICMQSEYVEKKVFSLV